jgi:hypothetical protein
MARTSYGNSTFTTWLVTGGPCIFLVPGHNTRANKHSNQASRNFPFVTHPGARGRGVGVKASRQWELVITRGEKGAREVLHRVRAEGSHHPACRSSSGLGPTQQQGTCKIGSSSNFFRRSCGVHGGIVNVVGSGALSSVKDGRILGLVR